MGEFRNVFVEPERRLVLRSEDVYQTEIEQGTIGYSDKLLAVVAGFKNNGAPEGFNAQCMVGKSKRGEVALRLFAVVDPTNEVFLRVGFKSRGCLAMTACASIACSLIEGRTFDEALSLTGEDIKEELGGVPYDKAHTVYFATEGVRALVGDYLARNGADLEALDQRVPCDIGGVACLISEHCSLRDTRLEMRFASLIV